MSVSVVAKGFIAAPGGETTNGTSHGPLVLDEVLDGDWLISPVTIAGGATTVQADGLGWDDQPAQQIASRSGYGTHGFLKQLTAADSGDPLTFLTSTAIKAATPWIILRGLKPGQTPVFHTVTGTAANPMTPPAFSPEPGKVVVHLIGMATATAAPPSLTGWTTPTGITMEQAATMGGTTGRAGAAIGVQLNENVGISGDWDSDASSSWGIIAIEFEVATDDVVPTPATVIVGAPSFAWRAPAAADALYTPAPTLSTTVGLASTIAGATIVTPDDARFRYRGASGFTFGTGTPDSACYYPSSRYPNGWGNPATYGVTFVHTGTEFELAYKWLSAVGAGWLRISVDGQRVTDLMYDIPGTSGGSMHTTKVTFPTSATRVILIEFQGVPFAGVYVGAGNTIAQAPDFTQRWIGAGDSMTAGSDGNTGAGAGTWLARLAQYAGVRIDPWNQAIGSTGMTAPGSAVTIPARIADVTAHDPDVVFLWCGGNDGTTSIVAEATQWIADVKAAVPDVDMFIVGTWSPSVVPSSARAARSTDLKNAALANGVPFIEPITGHVYDAAGNLIASQGPWIASSADVAAYVYSVDNVHATDAGHDYIAKRMAQAMQALGSPILADAVAPAPTVTAAAQLQAPAAAVTTGTAIAPSVTAAAAITAPVITATAAVLAPAVTAAAAVAAATIALAATPAAPTVTGAGGATIEPPAATATAGTLAPTLTGSTVVTPPRVALATVAHPPTITSGATLEVPVASYSAVTLAPTMDAAGEVTVAPPTIVAGAGALAPEVSGSGRVAPPAATLAAKAGAPLVTASAAVLAPVARATVTTSAPVVSSDRLALVTPPAAQLTARSLAPSVGGGTTTTASPAGAVAATALAPAACGAATVAAPVAMVTVRTFAPMMWPPTIAIPAVRTLRGWAPDRRLVGSVARTLGKGFE